jgi:hypothetical protein
MRIKLVLVAALIISLSFAQSAHAVKKDKAKGALFAASDGSGNVTLVWYPAYGKWPAGGWRLTDSKGATVAGKVAPLGESAMAALAPDDADGVKKLAGLLATTKDPKDLGAVYFNLGVVVLTDIDKARALGLSTTLTGLSAGKRSYKAVALDGSGKTMYTISSAEVDPSKPTPVSPAPAGLRAEATKAGAVLYWRPVPEDRAMPVMAYAVERDWPGQSGAPLSEEPLFMAATWGEDEPAFKDADAPVEQEITYRVYGLDVFGRRGAPATVKIFMPDLKALDPPTFLTAEPDEGRVGLSWKRNESPNTAGYVVERSFASNGIYETLTPKGLGPDKESYDDKGLMPGSFYYYRVRSIGPRGDLGEPTSPVMATPLSVGAPERPEGLKADVGPTRVRLTWDKPKGKIAGYIVERKGEGAPRWAMLNSSISPEPRYDDKFNLGEYGRYAYRVSAVGFDNAQSKPSSEVEVMLEDKSPPPAPHLTGIDGSGGVVRLTFTPGLPEEKTAGFAVVRGTSPEDTGLVIGDTLPAGARSFEDDFVKPGEDYWYALVAVDKAGNRSTMSGRLMVFVGTPDIPDGQAPKAKLIEEPFRHVELEFGTVPEGFAATVQYATSEKGPWTMLVESLTGDGKTVHTRLPDAGMVYYRVVYKAANGVQGRPSAAVGVNLK